MIVFKLKCCVLFYEADKFSLVFTPKESTLKYIQKKKENFHQGHK